MALTAEERRRWRELEWQLTSEVPTTAWPIRNRGIKRRVTGVACLVLAMVVVLVAFAVVILAVIVKVLLIGVLGFVLMILGGTRLQASKHEGQPVRAIAPAARDAL